ncbi:uncharacterized protein BXZ73DRAFT_38778 [Epithele typhae]|uniref:uncharacterized protein n=1 Tax=Epithele typhae TaxID=378194 RepID=UPI0020073568|nr:uncharacterized protein BXZ73DRAFT_38778 [Epithele typhae]KAH9945056.1 hypothetical protein BXZ73DRAFT_38778 [Epithele typhae]
MCPGCLNRAQCLRTQLLQLAVPLVKSYGFTREALAQSALRLPTPHEKPLTEAAITALFGEGDDARRTLIGGWLEHARVETRKSLLADATPGAPPPSMRAVLEKRLRVNEEVLPLLPEAFALLASPTYGLPPLDPIPGLKHVSQVADDACYLVRDTSVGPAWFRRRATVAVAYGAAELHQLTSPNTAYKFLDDALSMTQKVDSAADDIGQYGRYIMKSWTGIIRSSGVLP